MLSLIAYPYFEATNCIATLIFVWGDYKFMENKQKKNERRMAHLQNHLKKDSLIYNIILHSFWVYVTVSKHSI